MAKTTDNNAESDVEKANENQATEWLNSLAGDGIRIRVFRRTEEGTFGMMDVKPKDGVTDDYLLRLRPGVYLLTAVGTNGKVISRRQVPIEEGNLNRVQPDGQMVTDNGSDSSILEKMLMMQQSSSDRMMQMFMASSQQMTQVLCAALGGNRGGSVTELVQGLAGMKALESNRPERNILDDIEKLKGVADLFSGNGLGREKGMMEMVLDTAKEIIPSIMAARGLQPTVADLEELPTKPNPVRQILPAAITRDGTEGSGAPDGGAPPKPSEEIRKDVALTWKRLERAAELDMDPEGFASSILDLASVDAPGAQLIVRSIEDAITFEQWHATTGPIPENLKSWFGRFYLSMKELTKLELEIQPAVVTDKEKL